MRATDRLAFAHDASHYRMIPAGVVTVTGSGHVANLLRVARGLRALFGLARQQADRVGVGEHHDVRMTLHRRGRHARGHRSGDGSHVLNLPSRRNKGK